MAYQTIPASSSGSVAPGSIPVSSLATIASPRFLGLRTGGPAVPQALSPVDAITTIYPRGADLGDANVTVQPFVDLVSYYVMPAATMTASRTITVGNNNFGTFFPSTGAAVSLLRIARLDRSAFTLNVIRASDSAAILIDPPSPPVEREFLFICSPSGLWSANAIFLLRV